MMVTMRAMPAVVRALRDAPIERMPPLYFAGRDDELRKYDTYLETLCSTGMSNGLQLTIGVQGAGKTRLASRFVERVEDATIDGRVVATIAMSPRGLESPFDLFMEMADALDQRKLAGKVAQHNLDFPRLLTESKRQGMWDGKVLVLVIDELQRVSDAGIETLCELHDGMHKCPILLMGFGLQHTAMRLANVPGGRGISRIAAPIVIHSLGPADTFDAFARTLEKLGYDKEQVPDESLNKLVAVSQGFPQHINGYLDGAHRALAEHGHLSDHALEVVLRHGYACRVAYYDQRLAAAHSRKPMMVVAAAMEHAQSTTLEYHDAKESLAQAGFGEDVLDNAIVHGALTCDAKDNVFFGIPSFHSYMQHLLDREHSSERNKDAPWHR